MKKTLLLATAALLASVTGSYAVITDAVTGTYSLTYTPSAGAAGNMSFSSTPGDGSVCGVASPTCDDLGTATMSGQSVTNNPFFLDGVSHSGQAVLNPLTLNSPYTVNFFTASPNGSCVSCVTSINTGALGTSSGITGTSTGANITYGTITASFTFTLPSGATGAVSDTAVYAANYNGSLTCNGVTVPSQADCVVWKTGTGFDPLTVNFTDGAVMTMTLNNAIDWAITPTVTFNLTRGTNSQMAAAPEPASLAILGTAIAGMGLIRRRRKAV